MCLAVTPEKKKKKVNVHTTAHAWQPVKNNFTDHPGLEPGTLKSIA